MPNGPNDPNIIDKAIVEINKLWPIQQKGKAKRLTIAGPPSIEKKWHKALEQGRRLESSITDATFAIKAKKEEILNSILTYMDLNTLAVDGQFPDKPRAFKYAANSIHFIQKVHKYVQSISELQAAIIKNIGMLQSIEQNMLQMIQSNINALANLIGEVCNWGLPDLPAIPNLFSDSIWNWNGFNFFPTGSFKPHLSFDKNFAFGQCQIRIPNLNIFRNYPSQVPGNQFSYGTAIFNPPLGGIIGDASQYTFPTYIATMQATTLQPVYDPLTFNPNSSMIGSLPDPATIISAYQLPPATYRDNIISLNPSLLPIVIVPGDPDYNTTPDLSRSLTLRQYLIRFVNLDKIVISNFDPTLTATWLLYLNFTRVGRGGQWINSLQTAYDQLVQPSITALTATSVPYNNVLGGTGVVNAPQVPLISMLLSASSTNRENMLWKLSYIESGLLGYTRSRAYDSGADATFTAGFTGTDADYVPLVFDPLDTQEVILGASTSQYPTTAVVPKAILNVFNKVVELAAVNIFGAPNYQTNLTRFRFIYDPFAQATAVDRFTQFWRTFNYNFQQLLLQDSYLVSRVVSYVLALDSAIDPLADAAIFNQVKSDSASRNRNWEIGTPLLNIPKAPIVTYQNNSTPTISNGWNGDVFNPADFINRPDIQALPIPVQTAMLRTNLSYSILLSTKSDLQATIADTIQQAQAAATGLEAAGFHVLVDSPVPIPSGGSYLANFQKIDYDITHNVTSPTLFTIQTAGTYVVSGTIQWGTGIAGIRSVNLLLNNTTSLFMGSTTSLATGPIAQNFSAVVVLKIGDTLQVVVSNQTTDVQNLIVGTELSASIVPEAYSSPAFTDATPSGSSSTTKIIAGTNLVSGQAVRINSAGQVVPIDPVSATATSIPFVDGLVTTAVISGLMAEVVTNYGSEYVISGANFTIGGIVYAGPNGVLTQNYSNLVGQVNWIVVVGKAVSSTVILFQPQLPLRSLPQF
jgi:hypothetical protein